MGFNFGAFAGGLAQGGMQTYQTLEAIESQKKRDALVELQTQEAKQNMEERAKLREAGEVYGKVGGQDYTGALQTTTGMGQQQAQMLGVNTGVGGDDFDRAVNQSTAAVALENKARAAARSQGIPTDDTAIAQQAQAGAAGMKPTAYTREQADADYLRRVSAINPEKALDIEGKQMQVATGRSALKRIQAEDEFSTWHQKAQQEAYADPVAFMKANLATYNNAKKGSHLDDGMTADVVPSADGKTFSFVQKDSKGKVVGSTPINQTTAAEALKHIAFDKYSALPGKFKEAAELGFRKTEVDYKGREVKVKEDLVPSEIRKNNALANQASAHAGVYTNLLETAKNNKAAGEAMQPFLTELSNLKDPTGADKAKADQLLMQAATAGAQKSKDVASLLTILRKPDRSEVTAEERTAAYKELSEAGTSPEAIRAVKAKWSNVFGPSELDKAIAAKKDQTKNKPAAEPAAEKPKSALPTKTTATPDFNVKGGRGVYTVTGLPSTYRTKADAEKAAQEAQKKRREAEVSSALERD